MILIAENLNSSLPFVEKALSEWDEATLIDLVKKLDESPADYLDLNAGTFLDQEASVLSRLIHLVRQHTQKPLVLDSPDPLVLSSVCRLAGEGLLLNSITLEPTRFSLMLELAHETSAGLIALLMHEDRMPQGVDERLQIALIIHRDPGPQFRGGIVGGHIGLGVDAVRGLFDHGELGEGLGDPGAGVGQLLAVAGIGGREGRGRWRGASGHP